MSEQKETSSIDAEKLDKLRALDKLIRYHQDGLAQYRMQMSPSAQYLEEQTIKRLEELKAIQMKEDS